MVTSKVNLQITNKAQGVQLTGKEVIPIFWERPRIQDDIALVAPAEVEVVVIDESGVSCSPDMGEDCLDEASSARVDYLH